MMSGSIFTSYVTKKILNNYYGGREEINQSGDEGCVVTDN